MALKKRGKYWYGDSHADIAAELLRYSQLNGYDVDHHADSICTCGKRVFRMGLDENEGVAVRTCIGCGIVHPIADGQEYLDDAELEECACPCGGEEFEITVGISLYENSDDVRWLYMGARCVQCGLTATYGDWKNEFIGYKELLSKV